LRCPRPSGTSRGDLMLPQQQPDWPRPCQHRAAVQGMVSCCSSDRVFWDLDGPICAYQTGCVVFMLPTCLQGPCWQHADQDCCGDF
jgi:hypothetical protein